MSFWNITFAVHIVSALMFCFKVLFLKFHNSCTFLVDINDPISQKADFVVDQSKVDMLLQFGFQEAIAKKALKASVSFVPLPHTHTKRISKRG